MTQENIIGYKTLSEKQIARVNEIKQLEMSVLQLIQSAVDEGADPHWGIIGKTDIQKGFMSLARAVTRPWYLPE